MSNSHSRTNSLIIGDMVFTTSGNIEFSEGDEGNYFLAESAMLDQLDQAVQNGILENGMQSFCKKFKA